MKGRIAGNRQQPLPPGAGGPGEEARPARWAAQGSPLSKPGGPTMTYAAARCPGVHPMRRGVVMSVATSKGFGPSNAGNVIALGLMRTAAARSSSSAGGAHPCVAPYTRRDAPATNGPPGHRCVSALPGESAGVRLSTEDVGYHRAAGRAGMSRGWPKARRASTAWDDGGPSSCPSAGRISLRSPRPRRASGVCRVFPILGVRQRQPSL
jgi:hypothetical protein